MTIHDDLPAGANLDWSLSPAFPGCAITGAVGSEKLDCSFTSVGAGASRGPIHVTSPTGRADCGVIDNTATVDASNDDAKSNGATVTVQCPDVSVVKTPDAGTVNAGDNAVFTMVVTNAGPRIGHQRHPQRPAAGRLRLDARRSRQRVVLDRHDPEPRPPRRATSAR